MQRLRLHLCATATSTDTMNVNGGRSVTYRSGGEGGIRTHGRISSTHAFQACSLNRSDTSPCFVANDFINLAETACRRTAPAGMARFADTAPHLPGPGRLHLGSPLLDFLERFRDRLIGRTSAFGAEYPGSSPGPGTTLPL